MSCRKCDSCPKCLEKVERRRKRKQCSRQLRRQNVDYESVRNIVNQAIEDNNIKIVSEDKIRNIVTSVVEDNNKIISQNMENNKIISEDKVRNVVTATIENNNKIIDQKLENIKTIVEENKIISKDKVRKIVTVAIEDNNKIIDRKIEENNGKILTKDKVKKIVTSAIEDNNKIIEQKVENNSVTTRNIISSVIDQKIKDNNKIIKQKINDNNVNTISIIEEKIDNKIKAVTDDCVRRIIEHNAQLLARIQTDINDNNLAIAEEIIAGRQKTNPIDNFNPWNISDYNGDKTINIVHKKYFYNSIAINKPPLKNSKAIDILTLNIVNYLRFSNILNYNLMLEDSLNGIQKIFQEYAEIIAVTGDKISYTYLPITNADKLKMLFDIIITGRYTNGSLDTIKLIEQFDIMLENAKLPNNDKLKLILDKIKTLLVNDQHLTSWHHLIFSYQKITTTIYPMMKNCLQHNDSLEETNLLIHQFCQLGQQIGTFLGFFYGIVYFLHYFLDVIEGKDNIIREIPEIFDIQLTWWKNHVLLICDYYKASALEDKEALKDISHELDNFYTYISSVETFVLFHHLIKVRKFYTVLDGLKL